MSVERVYLVISADRRIRAVRRLQIRRDEVAIAVNVTFPDTWGKVVGSVNVTVPDYAPSSVEADESGSTA